MKTRNAPGPKAEGAHCQFAADSSALTTTIVREQYLARHGVSLQRAGLIAAFHFGEAANV